MRKGDLTGGARAGQRALQGGNLCRGAAVEGLRRRRSEARPVRRPASTIRSGLWWSTDPPFGLPKAFDDLRKELPYSGIYRQADGELRLVIKDLAGPNGLAFSPDEDFLYVGNWDPERKVVMRYPVEGGGTLGEGDVFFDMTPAPGEDAIDGLKVDRRGNAYVSGPGGIWILSPEGRHLGTISGPEHPHNFTFGDEDGRTLYIAARTGLYRLRLGVPGIRAADLMKPARMADPMGPDRMAGR